MVAILKDPYPALRTMTADDLEQVAAIEMSAYEYPWTHGIFRDCLRAGYDCIVLVHGIEVVGYGVLSAAAGEAHVLNVCVAPELQGRGHGRRLLHALLKLARGRGVARVFLEVRPSNAHAIALLPGQGRARGCAGDGDGTVARIRSAQGTWRQGCD
jgi:ribosomal-protein-alanine N-acetyltransferase